jgi:hypothetical protein
VSDTVFSRLTRYASPSLWREWAGEFAWQATAPDHTIARDKLTWPVSDRDLERISIRWPNKASYPYLPRKAMGDQVLAALRRFLPVAEVPLEQPFDKCINIEVTIDGRTHMVVIETSDYAPLNETAYEKADLHFKMEFSKEGYGHRPRLLPGGYVNADSVIYKYLPRLRQMRDEQPPEFEVYGRYGLSMEKRRRPIELLRATTSFAYYGGTGKVRYSKYLQEAALSRICIDLPSMSSVTWRMIDLLAIGSCIVGPPHTNQMQVPFENGVHVAYCREDYSDLIEVCRHYLDHEAEARKLVVQSRSFFDTYLHRDQLAAYYIHQCLKHLS